MKRQGQIQRAFLAFQLFSAMPPLEAVKVFVSIMMSAVNGRANVNRWS